jgi:hypothetical protein
MSIDTNKARLQNNVQVYPNGVLIDSNINTYTKYDPENDGYSCLWNQTKYLSFYGSTSKVIGTMYRTTYEAC